MRLSDRIRGWLRLPPRVQTVTAPHVRGTVDHIIILDGTMSSMEPGHETNAGLTYQLLCESVPGAPPRSIRYEQGAQWLRWRDVLNVIEGRGINRQIRRTYGFIASRYRPGDRIFFFGYSRGAYAARSLAGLIDHVGLLRAEHATVRNIRQAYRLYELQADPALVTAFHSQYCHDSTAIEMIGVWDTVKSLGFRAPIVWRWAEAQFAFHNHRLGPSVKHGFHALAADETREAFAPVLWESTPRWKGRLEQVWFRGAHGDIGAQLSRFEAARPLANIPLVWMLEKAEECGLKLPGGWRARFPQNPEAPSVGTRRGWGKFFLFRKRRVIGADPSESFHPSTGRKLG